MTFTSDHSVFYLVRPRPALEPRIASRVSPALQRVLLQPVLLGNSEAPGAQWAEEDYAAAVKLTFLAALHQYDETRSDDAYAHVFGAHRLTPALFDRWWTIERIPFGGWLKNLQPMLHDRLHNVEKSGNALVDLWINSLR